MEDKMISYETSELAKGIGFQIKKASHSLLAKWMREKKGIFVNTRLVRQNSVLEGFGDFYDGSILKMGCQENMAKDYFPRITLYKDPEECMEEVLKKAIHLIKSIDNKENN